MFNFIVLLYLIFTSIFIIQLLELEIRIRVLSDRIYDERDANGKPRFSFFKFLGFVLDLTVCLTVGWLIIIYMVGRRGIKETKILLDEKQ